ncbi:uncharacterized protein LOC125528476 [Triticum urartu]|uniref:uncharacterized protein LOC125528476 n=1 Tax=Triticum urartu TaxID=4572 RepID=UPI002043DE62|nr:uncharacterized protein LOC125528476 [Triticum urartu]
MEDARPNGATAFTSRALADGVYGANGMSSRSERPVPMSLQGACRLDDWLVHISSEAPSIGRHGRCCSDEEKLLLQDVLLLSYPHTWHWCPIIECTDATTATRSWPCVSSITPWRSSISSPMLTQSRSPPMLSSTLHEVQFALGCSCLTAAWSSVT